MLHIDHFLTIYITFLAAVAGAAGGSFVNCLAWRTVNGEKVTSGRSHCTHCGHTLGFFDLIPILSWFALKGRCRYCNEKISPRYVSVEILAALASVALLFRFDVSVWFLYYLGFTFILLAEGLVDSEIYQLPDRFHGAAIIWWCLFLPARGNGLFHSLLSGLSGGLLIGGGLLGLSLVFDKLLGRTSLGGGDIKLFFVTGLYLGFAVNLLNLILSCVLGLVFGAISAEARKKKEDPAAIPFGPAIGAAAFICILTGKQIVGWYLGLFF